MWPALERTEPDAEAPPPAPRPIASIPVQRQQNAVMNGMHDNPVYETAHATVLGFSDA